MTRSVAAMTCLWASLAACLMAWPGAARGEDDPAAKEPPQPHQLIRTLQMLQDKIAFGSIEAHRAQLTVIKHVSDQFLQAGPEVWKDRRNANSAILFLLSGGPPATVKTLLLEGKLSADDKILKGALAYVEGREKEALGIFENINPRTLPLTLGGQIALVKSALLVNSDLRGAMIQLDDARLLTTGTLVEEAALRRQIFVAGQVDDFNKFEMLAIQYLRRYRHSIYAGNFRQRFALGLTRFSFAQDAQHFPRLVGMLEFLDEKSRLSLYLLIARTALMRGKVTMAEAAAGEADKLAAGESAEKEQARLYRASARVVTSAYETGLAELASIDVSRVPPMDAELRSAALSLARSVRKAPLAGQPLPDVPAPEPNVKARVPTSQVDLSSSSTALDQANKMMSDVDNLLKQERP